MAERLAVIPDDTKDARGVAALLTLVVVGTALGLLGDGAWGLALIVFLAALFGAGAAWFFSQGEVARAEAAADALDDEIDRLEDELGKADDELDEYDHLRRLIDDALFHGFTAKRKRELERWLNAHPSHREHLLDFVPTQREEPA